MTIHLLSATGEGAACGDPLPGEPVALRSALRGERQQFFDCVACHKTLTRGRRHSDPQEEP